MISVDWFGILCILVLLTESRSRKYDVDSEARKIYGQDLKSVLLRFRKTPDYIQILNEELSILHEKLKVAMLQYSFYYAKKLKERVEQVVCDNSTNGVLRTQSTSGDYYTKYIGIHRKPIVRQHTHNMSGVERLEQYVRLNPTLSLNMRNRMVDLGFEYSGHVIHGIIKSISPDENSMSTMQAMDASEKIYTTHSSHQVTRYPTTLETTENPALYRNFNKDTRHV
ncbi:uncharacterized protein LOC123704706 [Colias croceus]|uniref:uncharacterized protein LOC123704706 n=1 Tax=Colias crocea TaxID=72248 RepID=UPI001E279FB1|nr:uncharacterized protein LOC123704706 [Colias croceus]